MLTGKQREEHEFVLPGGKIHIGLLKDVKENRLNEGIEINQRTLDQLYTFILKKHEDYEKTFNQLKQKYAENIKTPNLVNAKAIQEKQLHLLENQASDTNAKINEKVKLASESTKIQEEKKAQTHKLKSEVEQITNNQLHELTTKVTEKVLDDIHKILSSDPKDYTQIRLIESVIGLLRKNQFVDHVIANVFL